MKKKNLLWILALAYVIDRLFKRKQPETPELTMELKYTPGPERESVKLEVPKDILCPYCNYRFVEMPKRSCKCPECKEYIHRMKDYDRKIYRLATVKEYEKEARIEADKQWAELNKDVVELSKSRDWDAVSYKYFQMALQLQEEGKDFFHVLQESTRFKLRYFKKDGITRVSISDSGEASCPACRNQRGKIYSIEDALKEMPIPCKDCTFDLHGIHASVGWCRCVYVAELDFLSEEEKKKLFE